MSSESRYHFAALGACASPIEGNYNDYNNPNAHLVRFDNTLMTVNATEIDDSDVRILQCAHNETEEACLPVPGINCEYFTPNPGNIPEITDSAAIENLFWDALEDFCDGVLSCECIKLRLFDAMQAASLGSNNEEKLMLLQACIEEKERDSLSVPMTCIPTFILIMKGEAQERLGKLDSAIITYNKILNNYSCYPDTTYARWRLMFIDAQISDSTYNEKYDSLMKIASTRYMRDIGKLMVDNNPPPPPAIMQNNDESQQEPEQKEPDSDNKINSDEKKNKASSALNPDFNQNPNETDEIATLEQNTPNPFTNETVIVFHLNREADVRLGIHNALGHTIKEVVNQRLRKGKYVYTFQNENNASGVYLYLLTTDGKQIVKKMQIVK